MFWGAILILIGIVFLLDNLGLFGNISVWNLIWPLVLILVGARILYGTVFRRAPETEHSSVPLEGAQRARIKVQHGAGRLNVRTGGGMGVLAEGDFAGGVNVSSQREGNGLSVRMSVPENLFPFDWIPGGSLDWSFGLSPEIPIALEFETGAGEARLDLRELKISDVHLKSGASSTVIDLPTNAGFTRVRVEAGAASVEINVPSAVAAHIRSKGGLSSLQVDTNRFSSIGSNEYQSPDFATAENKVEMDIEMGVGSVRIR
jgi:hypothetical protein